MEATPVVAFLATAILASVGLSPSPNAAGLVGLLVAIQMYQRLFSRRADKLVSPWAASTIGAMISHSRAASNALQASALSIVLTAVISAAISGISVAVIYLDSRYIGKNHRYNWPRLAAFPALWASTWGIISVLTPLGRLLTWSPVTGLGPYTWVSSYLGPWGIDFVMAAWSVVLTEAVAIPLSQHALLVKDPEEPRNVERATPYTDDPDTPASQDHSTFYHKSAFTLFLLTLVVPSLWTPTIPNPTYTSNTTPFTLGCALPQTHLPHGASQSPTLDDYIKETRKMTNAKLVLWPEGALRFNNEAERNKSFERIYNDTLKSHKGLYIGVGFEENAPESWGKRASKRNGFALLVEDKVVLQYYKRNLVPSTLMFRLTMTGLKLTLVLQLQSRFPCSHPTRHQPYINSHLGPPQGQKKLTGQKDRITRDSSR